MCYLGHKYWSRLWGRVQGRAELRSEEQSLESGVRVEGQEVGVVADAIGVVAGGTCLGEPPQGLIAINELVIDESSLKVERGIVGGNLECSAERGQGWFSVAEHGMADGESTQLAGVLRIELQIS